MKKKVTPQSLITWLKPENNAFSLKLLLRPQELPLKNITQTPFQIIYNSNSFTRIVWSKLVTAAGVELKNIFILQQKDFYCYSQNALENITNSDVDDHWQKYYLNYKEETRQSSFLDLFCIKKEKDCLIPFRSLFYCQLKQEYFHPPCPDCGTLLEQCYLNERLTAAGLQAYSTSLKRYLFCPGCSKDNFYAYQLEDTDPAFLQDRFSLVRGFGKLIKSLSVAPLPCASCDQTESCFGLDSKAVVRITPFSFYDFHIFAFDAMSLNAIDFLALLSGASVTEIKAGIDLNQDYGRVKCLEIIEQNGDGKNNFLFAGNEKWFLEILYLKLTYLYQLSQFALSPNALLNHQSLEVSHDQFWVKFPDLNGHLPGLWNFTVKPLGLGAGGGATTSPVAAGLLRLHSFALIWFSTLLANRQLPNNKINDLLAESAKSLFKDGFDFFTDNKLFVAENIFWIPQQQKISSQSQAFWTRALQLGLDLLKASQNQPAAWSAEQFIAELDCLTTEIKGSLFQSTTVDTTVDEQVENKAISELLLEIRNKWFCADATLGVSSIDQPNIENTTADLFEEKQSVRQASEETLDKTVLLPVGDQGHDALDKTVLLSVSGNAQSADSGEASSVDKKVEKPESLDETAILNPTELAKKLKKRTNE